MKIEKESYADINVASSDCFDILRNWNIVGDLFGISVFVACTVSHKVHFLSLPDNLTDTERKFYNIAHFQVVIGPSTVPAILRDVLAY